MIDICWEIDHPDLLLGVVEARGVCLGPGSDDLNSRIMQTESTLPEAWPPPKTHSAIRDLLRRGGYKPKGRNKPASEYLAAAAQHGEFPRINNLVDINNLLSLQTGWPMSIIDLERACGEDDCALEVRLGRKGESYVFNAAGHSIELEGLLGVGRRGGELLANPVKDAMTAKVHDETRDVIVFVYASKRVTDDTALNTVLDDFSALLRKEAAAAQVVEHILHGDAH